MSHPRYNAFAPGNQMSLQGPYRLSGGQMERDPQRGQPNCGSGSSYTSSGSSSSNCGPPGRPIPSLLSLPVKYRPEKIGTRVDKDMERHLDLNISRAREHAMQYSASQSPQFTNVQKDTFSSSFTEKNSFLMSAPAQVGPLNMDSGGSNLDWLPICQTPSKRELPKAHSPAVSSSFQSSRIQTTGGLRDYGTSFLDQRGTPQETIQPRYISELATNILLQFGLQREDLDQLSSYPEDQLTPQNLPFILRQIHLEKVKRTSNPYDESQPIGSMEEFDMPNTPRSSVPDSDELTSQVFTSSKVIDYGHTSKSELSSFGSLNKDSGFGQLKSNVPKTNPLKKSAPAHQEPSKTQPSKPSSNLMRGVHPGRPRLVLIGSNAETDNSDRRRSGEQSSNNPKMRDKKKINPQQKQQLQRHQQLREPSQRDAVTCSGSSKKLPTRAMMQDYAGATPRVFPHTCCLCMKECTSMKDWQYHRNTGIHLDNCRKLRQRYPVWDGQTPEIPSGPGKDTQPASSTSQNLQHRHQRSVHENQSRSLSPLRRNESEDRKERQDRRDRRLSPQRSRSPHPHHASDSRRERRDSRSRSSQTSRQTFRSRSRSYERPVSSRHRSRSRSHERRSPPSRREAKRSSPRRSHEHRPSPRRSEERHSSPRRNYERRSSGDGSEPHQKRSRSADRLTKRLLEETAVHSRSTQSDLEAMVKTLAPVLLAELANLKSYAALSSSTSRTENKSSSNSTKASSSSQRTRTSSSRKQGSGFNEVTLSGVLRRLSYSAILKAMEKTGKVKSLTLFRSRLEARVQFEKEDDARKLVSYGGCKIKGYTLSVSGATGIASNKPLQGKEQKMAPKNLSSKSTSTKFQTSHTISKSTATSKLVTKAKVLVSKAKSISTKQLPKTVKKSTSAGKSAGVKSIGVKQAASLVPKATTAGKKPEANKIKTVKNTKPVRTLQQSKTTSTAKAQTTIKELQQSSESKTDAVEKQKKPTNKTKKQQDSVLMKKEKSSMDENKERKLSSGRFNELDFSTGDFVTVDEVNEDMVDKTENRSFSSKPTSEEKEAGGSAVHTGVRKTLSSYSSSKSAKGNQSGSTSAGVNPNTKSSSKLKKCVTNAKVDKTSPSSPFVKSIKTPSSSGQKAQTVKKKPPNRSLGPSSSVGNNCSSATAQKTSIKNQQGHQKHKKPAESTVTKPDHKGSLENVAAYTVVTKSTSDASSQMDISAEGQILQGNVEKDLKDETIQEMIEKKAKGNDTNSKNTEENGRDVKKEVLGFLHKDADEQQNGEDQEKKTESQIPQSEQDCTAVEMADTDKLDDCHEMEMDVSTKPQDSTPVEQATIGINNSKQTPGSVSEKMELENKEDDQGKKTRTQIPGPEKDQTIHQCGLEVVEGADKMEIDVSTKPQDITSVEQETTADGGDEGPTLMQVSERDEAKEIHSPEESSVSVTSDRDKETSEDTNPTPNSGGGASTLKPKEGILLSEKVCETSKAVGQISNEDQPLETGASKDTLKDQKLVDPTDQLAKSEDKFKEEVYRAIDSSEDPPTKATTESEPEKKEGTEKERTTRSGDYRTRESRSRSRTSKSEEKDKTTKQLDEATRKPTTKTSKTKKGEMSVKDLEEPVYEVLDSIEDDAVEETSTNTGRRRSARGKKTDEKILAQVEEPKTSEKVEEIFTVLDSVEDERPEDKAVTTRSTRGRKENAAKKVEENAKTRDNKTPRRRTPARDSKEKDTEKSPKTDVGVSSKESTPTKMSDTRHKSEESTAHKTLGAVKEEIVKKQTSRRGRPKKDNNTTKQQTADLKKGDSPINTVEEESFKILDSVEDEVVDDLTRLDESKSATKSDVPLLDTAKELVGLPLNEEEEEPIYQVVDSLEEEQFQDGLMTETSMQEESETKDDMVKNTDHLPSGSSTVELSEQTGEQENTLLQSRDKPSEVKEDPSVKKPETEKKGITSKADVQKVDRPPLNKPDRNLGASDKMLKSAKRDEAKSKENVLVNLDQVSEEEEDYPDDAAEEKELMKRQAAARKRETNREERRSRERETRERRSRSGSSSRGGGSGKPSSQTEKCQEDLEKVDLDKQDLVTLDEVGEDEVGEEGLPEAPPWHREISEAELLELVTLDEIAEEEDGQVETLPQSPENQPVDSVKPETLSALTETVQTEDKKDDNEETKQPPSSSKRKQSDNTEESGNFVTVDELGEVEKEEKETVTRGRPRKRSRQTPGRKSTRGKGVKEEHQRQEEENKSLPPASLDSSQIVEESTLGPSGDHQPESQNIDEENHSEAASAEPQPLTDGPDGQKAEGIEEVKQEHSRPSVKVGDKRKQEVSGSEAKRSRSQSPGVPVDLHLTPSNSTGPCGQEYVVPKSGFYCNLCSIFYFNETTAMEVHCSSQKHYDNLLIHNQRLQQTPQLTSAQDVEASLSD